MAERRDWEEGGAERRWLRMGLVVVLGWVDWGLQRCPGRFHRGWGRLARSQCCGLRGQNLACRQLGMLG